MAGLSDLVNNITGSISGLISDITGGANNVVQYNQGDAEIQGVQSTINPESWNKLIFPYTFSVVSLDDASKPSGFSDFELPLAPQSITQREEPALSIRPTQGGTSVNHGGLGYKTLTIAGTTGIAPFRGAGGVNAKTGEAIFQPKGLKYKSGYEVFLHLRNWFRSYYEWKKKQGKDASSFRLVFKNYKDGEFLIVELQSFDMDRNATKSFLYDYKMEFKVLSHYTFKKPGSGKGFLAGADELIENALNKINIARGVFLRTQGILRQIESTYDSSVLEPMRQTTLALKAFLGVPLVAADIGSRIIVETVSTAKALALVAQETANFLTLGATGNSATLAEIEATLDKRIAGNGNKLQNTINATNSEVKQNGPAGLQKLGALGTKMSTGSFPKETLDRTGEEQRSAANLPRTYYETAIEDLERVKRNAEDFFALGSKQYDQIFDRASTLNADATKTVTDEEFDVLYAFNEALTGMYLMLSTTDMFKSSFDERVADIINRFEGKINLQSNQAVRQLKLEVGMTLEKLAQRELGDSTRWGEIAEVNGLKPPYVSSNPQESRDGVLGPGANILIPTPVLNGFSQAPQGKINRLTAGMSELEKSLGVDFKVDGNFDLVLGSSGDFELIAGADNMAQGTILKLSYEPGDVMLYPELGAGAKPGGKFPPLIELKDRITKSLLQDNRIQRVTDLALTQDNSALTISFNLYVKQVDLPIPVKIKV